MPLIIGRRLHPTQPPLDHHAVDMTPTICSFNNLGHVEPGIAEQLDDVELPCKRLRRTSAPSHRNVTIANSAPPHLIAGALFDPLDEGQPRPARQVMRFQSHAQTVL